MSKPKPNNLAIALNKQAGNYQLADASADRTDDSVETPSKKEPRKETTTREGRVMVSGWLPLEARSSFKLIQAKHPAKRMQDLVEEAMNDLFAKYNVPQTAKLN